MESLITKLESILLKKYEGDSYSEIDNNLSIEELNNCIKLIDNIMIDGISLRSSIYDQLVDKYSSILNNIKYNNVTYISNLEDASISSNVCDKIGGLPLMKKGEEWPKSPDGNNLTFIAQFRYPILTESNKLYRIFVDLNDKLSNYYRLLPMKIKETNKYLKHVKLANPSIHVLKEYKIHEWVQNMELKSFTDIKKDPIPEIENLTEDIYDKILNSRQEKSGIKIHNKGKLIFTINADILNIKNDDGIYYFYKDETMQYLSS